MGRKQNLPFLKVWKMKMSNFTFCQHNVKGGDGLRGDLENTGRSGPGPTFLCQGKSCRQKLDRKGSRQVFTP